MFKKAERTKTKARIMISGFAGSGKTMTGMRIAEALAEGGPVFVINSENVGPGVGASEMYSSDVEHLSAVINPPYHSRDFVGAINAAINAGAEAIVIDSASHQWEGILKFVDEQEKTARNKAAIWGKATPLYDAFMEAVMTSPVHMIVTYRVQDKIEIGEGGKVIKVPEKIIARKSNQIEYEYSLALTVDKAGTISVNKTRYTEVPSVMFEYDDQGFYDLLVAAHNTGAPLPKTREGFVAALGRMGYKNSEDFAILKDENEIFENKWNEDLHDDMLEALKEIGPKV